jgi:hypothetical protein
MLWAKASLAGSDPPPSIASGRGCCDRDGQPTPVQARASLRFLLDRVSGRRKVELSPRRNPELSADLRLRTRLVQKALFLRMAGGDIQERPPSPVALRWATREEKFRGGYSDRALTDNWRPRPIQEINSAITSAPIDKSCTRLSILTA